MRSIPASSILALSLLLGLSAAADAAPVRHSHQRHALVQHHHGPLGAAPAWGSAYAASRPPMAYQPAPNGGFDEPYFGASQGYAPGEKEQFLHSLWGP
ncbi:hypothetical protein [Bradyrhizobium sp. HKCCYLS20291]|uniref:hypothetical protein n=1 Tax=Bradyrhizobium sp. HKCCYLS20291 TaxID=3420766 RepID=UPI003EB6F676